MCTRSKHVFVCNDIFLLLISTFNVQAIPVTQRGYHYSNAYTLWVLWGVSSHILRLLSHIKPSANLCWIFYCASLSFFQAFNWWSAYLRYFQFLYFVMGDGWHVQYIYNNPEEKVLWTLHSPIFLTWFFKLAIAPQIPIQQKLNGIYFCFIFSKAAHFRHFPLPKIHAL